MKTFFKLGGRNIINQKPSALTDQAGPEKYLPILLRLVTAIEEATGYKWRVTSYVRDSPSHKTACALDIAPDISPKSKKYYAVFNNSDPVLYKRLPLIRALQVVAERYDPTPYSAGIFIEPDHLHVQLFTSEGAHVIRVIQWKQAKDIYPDTATRMKLPVTEEGYRLP